MPLPRTPAALDDALDAAERRLGLETPAAVSAKERGWELRR